MKWPLTKGNNFTIFIAISSKNNLQILSLPNARPLPAFFIPDPYWCSDNRYFVFCSKLQIAKETFSTLLQNLTENDYFNVVLYNGKYGEKPLYWHPKNETMQNQLNKEKVDLEAFATSDDNVVSAINYVNSIRSEDSNVTFLNTAFEYVINLKNEGI